MKKTLLAILAFVMLIASAGCTDNSEKAFKASEMIKNAELWNGKYMFDDEFKFVVEYFNLKSVEAGLGTNYTELGGDFIHNENSIGEWSAQLVQSDMGMVDGLTKTELDENGKYGPVFNLNGKPETLEEAYDRLISILSNFREYKYTAMDGLFAWSQYAAAAGFEVVGQELGENILSYQYKIAATRSAAKEFDTPWFIDYSMWLGSSVPDYAEGDNPTGGHSTSLMERTVLLSYLSGADTIVAEAGENLSFYGQDSMELTPYGNVMKHLNEFSKNLGDRGTTYTPFCLLVDKFFPTNYNVGRGCYSTFSPTEKEWYTYDVYGNLIWYGSLYTDETNENFRLVNNKYGDLFDTLWIDSSEELLRTYPVMILLGNADYYNAEQKTKLYNYVKNGGILVLNTAYAELLTSADIEIPSRLSGEMYKSIEYGDGKFIVFGEGGAKDLIVDKDGNFIWTDPGDWKIDCLDVILDELYEQFVPVRISDLIGYNISVRDGSLLIYLANNDGITKSREEKAVVDSSKAKDITVEYVGEYTLHSAEDIYNHKEVTLDGTKATLHLEPGEVAVLELKIGKQD